MAGVALRRLMTEYRQLCQNPPEGIVAGPADEDNFFEWHCLISGPEGTCFEYGIFPAKLTFSEDYPLSPPKMQFLCDIFHPNIYADGKVCISILHTPGDDPTGYETSAERWSPVQSVEKILISVVSMLAEPNDESAANVNAAKMWRDDRAQFDRIAHNLVRGTLVKKGWTAATSKAPTKINCLIKGFPTRKCNEGTDGTADAAAAASTSSSG